jgi:hypothetical protein
MTETPIDLMPLKDVLAHYKPRRKWWETQIKEHHITRYVVPGTRGIYFSRAEVEELLRPRPLLSLPAYEPKEEPTE